MSPARKGRSMGFFVTSGSDNHHYPGWVGLPMMSTIDGAETRTSRHRRGLYSNRG